MKILCVENDKYGSRPAAIYVLKTDHLSLDELCRMMISLSFRSRLNPELVYYVTCMDERKIKYTDEQIVSLFKKIGDDNEIFERI
jgi:hypothetical protein